MLAKSYFGNAPSTASNYDDFDFLVNSATTHGHTINFDIDIASDEEGGVWSDTFTVPVSCLPPPIPLNLPPQPIGNNLKISWTDVNAESYEVWKGVNDPYFLPGDCASSGNCFTTSATTYTDSGVMGDGDLDTYLVRSVSIGGQISSASNRVGKIDFDISPGSLP